MPLLTITKEVQTVLSYFGQMTEMSRWKETTRSLRTRTYFWWNSHYAVNLRARRNFVTCLACTWKIKCVHTSLGS